MNITTTTLLNELVDSLNKRQKDIVIRRFGIKKTSPTTLAKLGEKYNITRERVRQIEAAGLKMLRDVARKNSALTELHDKCIKHIERMGGVRRHDVLIDDLKLVLKDKDVSAPYIELLFSILKSPKLHQETDSLFAFWYVSKDALDMNKKFVDKVATLLKNKKEAVLKYKEFDSLFAGVVKNHDLEDFVALNLVLNSKKFAVNSYGDFGLSHWPEISPKTVRDKSYLVLKKRGEALHFKEIADEINRIAFDVKQAHPQTVHNELIKDDRFVLVGRGLYSLRELGVESGTTHQVISGILKKHGPLPADKVVKLVSEQRILKRNTIVLNLQNKKHFKKLEDGKYHIV